ncbi:glycosyltransferase [Rubritalea sp.]|uniref:glycosyltransferase n=1 Tax=Rubritalea sp. TaxID=2109375 RepID=UPI003EF0F323
MKKIKVAHSSAPMTRMDGGVFAAVRDLTFNTAHLGIENEVWMPFREDAANDSASWQGAHLRVTGAVRCRPIQWSPQFERELLASSCDILHTHGIWQHPSFVALKWKKKLKRPHIASVHGMLEPWALKNKAWKKKPVWKLWEHKNLQTADLLHATSQQEVDVLRALGLKAPIALIANGVDCEQFNIEDDSARDKTALFLSRVHPKKGLPLLIEAWEKVKPSGWKLEIAGPDSGGHQAELENQIKRAGLEEVIRFVGPLDGDEIRSAYSRASLFILPTYSENFGIVVAEALAASVPVITTKGAPWEILERENIGWWTEPSVEGIREALYEATCIKSLEDLREMGRRAPQVVREEYSWATISQQFSECYAWVLGQGEKPQCVGGN